MRWLRRLSQKPRLGRMLEELTVALQENRHEQAAGLAARAVETATALFGDDHAELVAPLYAQASANLALGDLDVAGLASDRALSICRAQPDCVPPLEEVRQQRAAIASRMGMSLGREGRFTEAGAQFSVALEILERGDDSLDLAVVLHNAATFRDPNADFAEAAERFARALAIAAAELSPAASLLEARIAHNFGVLRQEQLQDDAAELLYRQALKAFERDCAPNDPALRPTLARLGRLLQSTRRFEAAAPLFERALAIAKAELGPDHEITEKLAMWLGDTNSHTYR